MENKKREAILRTVEDKEPARLILHLILSAEKYLNLKQIFDSFF